ncbi:hypothetical protein HDU78_004118 [Chytriomyces hyalinus]|nr:hypothetical protein HDU78_004118 [Chytriomyces hyalinus]KAJ3254266.1 hypothetical protein HDU77_004150 [Chytriomyces hyalinus]KAJ3401981.1 hypothetical protein HDU80_005530 [Chytriomyces hyalinus]
MEEVDPRRRAPNKRTAHLQRASTPPRERESPEPSSVDQNIVFSVPIDPSMIEAIEVNARALAGELDRVIGNFESKMAEIATHAHDSVAIHTDAVKACCDALDASRSNMLALITTVDELSEDMAGVESLALQM